MFLLLHLQLRMAVFAIFGLSIFFLFFGAASAAVLEKCEPGTSLDEINRDGVKPSFPLKEDPRLETSSIMKAHEILRNGLHQFSNKFGEEDLGFYLNQIVDEKPTFKDEYNQEISSYFKVFESIWQQYNETLCRNYATNQFENDKLDLCSVARFLSHQTTVEEHETIMKRIGDALEYRCHPCTPYKREQFGQNIAPNTDHISPEGISLEERLVLCKSYDHQGKYLDTGPKPQVFNDFSPCSRQDLKVLCSGISLDEVRRAFNNQTSLSTLDKGSLKLQPYLFSETFIPEDVFGSKQIRDVWIGFTYNTFINRSLRLQVDADAFRSTKNYTKQFVIYRIDCTLLDLGFLSGFEQLTDLTFYHIKKIQHCLPSLPPLPRLTNLKIVNSTGMNQLIIFPTLTNGLKEVEFRGKFVTHIDIPDFHIDIMYKDETVDRIMDWLLLSSAYTLKEMKITYMTQTTRVPPKIGSFKRLKNLYFNYNNISTIKSGGLLLDSYNLSPISLDLDSNGIKEIEPGAFQGYFRDTKISLYYNKLTRFDESVFGPILQQMAYGKGFISANKNPIDCSDGSICHLAWLRRHSRFSLDCSNGTSFKDLQPAGFNHCS